MFRLGSGLPGVVSCLVSVGFLATCPALSAQTQTTAAALAPLDPDMRNVVLLWDAIKGTPLPSLTPQDARQQIPIQEAAKVLARGTGAARITVERRFRVRKLMAQLPSSIASGVSAKASLIRGPQNARTAHKLAVLPPTASASI